MTIQTKRYAMLATMTALMVAVAWFSTMMLNRPAPERSVSIEISPVD